MRDILPKKHREKPFAEFENFRTQYVRIPSIYYMAYAFWPLRRSGTRAAEILLRLLGNSSLNYQGELLTQDV
jgi:hypothetical protein